MRGKSTVKYIGILEKAPIRTSRNKTKVFDILKH